MHDDLSEPPDRGAQLRLTFGSPLSAERAARLTGEMAAFKPSTILDLGCGWGSLLLAMAAAAPSARAKGVDNDAGDVARGRAAAAAAGLADRVEFIEGKAEEHLSAADLVLNVGAWHALGTMTHALTTLRGLVNPGGHLLFAGEFWERPPTEAELGNMWPGITADSCGSLAEVADLAIAAGFRPLRIESVTRGEWEDFESGFAADREEWLLAHPGHPKAEEVRAELDQTRDIWLRGHRDVFGFAYLTLGVPATS
jgi:cyclopropane fatty-acyl-phospholipid synthase-like methyltransferase